MKKIISAIAIVLVALSLNSCLKDKGFDEGTTGLNVVPGDFIQIGYPNKTDTATFSGLDFKDKSVSVTLFYIRLLQGTAPEDITVTLDTTGAVALIRTVNPNYEKLPSSFYTLPGGLTYVIKKGTNQVEVPIITNSIQFDPSTAYALGFRIKSISPSKYRVAANYGNSFVAGFGAKNRYDGVYRVTGTLVDAASPSLGPVTPYWEALLVTSGGDKVDVYDNTYTGIIAHPIFSGGALSYYGSFGMVVSFDPNTSKVLSVVSPYVPASNTRYAELDATYDSYYDPATKIIKIKYYMYQPSVVATGPRTTFVETWTYTGPRP